jgi:hypothetical protein
MKDLKASLYHGAKHFPDLRPSPVGAVKVAGMGDQAWSRARDVYSEELAKEALAMIKKYKWAKAPTVAKSKDGFTINMDAPDVKGTLAFYFDNGSEVALQLNSPLTAQNGNTKRDMLFEGDMADIGEGLAELNAHLSSYGKR